MNNLTKLIRYIEAGINARFSAVIPQRALNLEQIGASLMEPFTTEDDQSETRVRENVVALNASTICSDAPVPSPILTALEGRRLGVLRDLLAKSRLEGDNDVDGAYARLTANGAADASSYGVTLFHTLPHAAHRRLEFFCRVCPNASHDEWWLLRLIGALQDGDAVNIEALLGFRIRKAWRRRVRYLAASLAARIDVVSTQKALANADDALTVSLPATVRTDGQAKL